MSFISLTHLQTALNKIKTMLNNKAELTDIPDKLPADGGNADTVDGKHAVDFLPNKAECVNGANYDDFAVSGFYEVLGDADNPTQNSPTGDETNNNFYLIAQRRSDQYCSQIAVSVRADNSVYIRNKSKNIWGSWTKIMAGNADTVNGHTVHANVPSGAIFTDTKVTSVANHYAPSADSNASLSASASGATAAWGIDVVKGVTLSRDAKGHVTGVSVTSGKIPANPNTDTKVTNTLAKTTKAYVTGTTSSSTNTGTQVFDTGVYLDTTAGQIVATTFKGALSGNASTATALTSSAGNSGKPIYFSNGKPVVCSTIITVRTGALPTTQSSSSSIKLSYLSNYSKATIFVYMNQSFNATTAVTANRVIDTITITGISSSMTAASYDLSSGSSTGCTVSINSAGVITLTVDEHKSYKQNYVVFYYN